MLHRCLLRAGACLLLLASTADATTTATVNATITIFSAITFSPAPLAFGNQMVGHSATKVFTVANGGAAAFIFGVSLTPGANSGEFSISNGCGASLAANASCQISVTFSPTVVGAANAGVALAGATRTYTGFVSGTGTNIPVPTPVSIALSPSSPQIQDTATGGSIVSTATVTMSDGSTNANCTLSTSVPAYYQISGLNVVLAHNLAQADDGQHNTVISVVSCP
jgi:hypothetical protein